jgi:hypothetical protein
MIYAGLKYQGETPWTVNMHIKKNEGQDSKAFSKGG